MFFARGEFELLWIWKRSQRSTITVCTSDLNNLTNFTISGRVVLYRPTPSCVSRFRIEKQRKTLQIRLGGLILTTSCQSVSCFALEFGMYAADTIVLPVQKKKELGSGTAQRRDWRGITTALLVIAAICGLIFLCGYIFTPLSANNYDANHQPFNLTDLKKFRPSIGAPNWIHGNRLVFDNDEGTSILTPDGNYTLLITNREIHDLLQRSATVQCNFDCSLLALSYSSENPSKNPENSSNIVNLLNWKTKSVTRVTRDPKQPEGIHYLLWNPRGLDYIFAQGGHLYYVAEPEKLPVDISSSSKNDRQIHGYFDWMTEEEIFGTRQASWWSNDGLKVAFASRDAAPDPAIILTAYRSAERYQIDTKLVYQKTGEKKLPAHTISIWDKTTGTLKQMDVQLRDSSAFHYLFAVSWVKFEGNEKLATVWSNRWQNHTSLTLCDFDAERCKLVFEYAYPTKMWAHPDEYKNLVTSKDSVFLILPRQMPNGNSYQHVARIRIDNGSKQFLSFGNFDVKSVVRHDEHAGLIYFTAGGPKPTNSHLYFTKNVMSSADAFKCVTCVLSNCSYANPAFSDDGRLLSVVCRGPQFHRYYLAELNAGQLDNIREVLHDSRLESLLERASLPIIIDDTIQLDNGIEATIRLYLPRTRTHVRAVPLLVYVYGGPGYQTIDDTYSISWLDYLVTNLHIAVLKIDARGSGSRGWKYRSPVYGALGHIEMEDQIAVTKLALKKYHYLDASRVTLHGWSYGGFATLRIVEMAPDRMFKCAISGAPVTNFQYYDAAYTERYMGAAPKESYVDVTTGNLAKFKLTKLLLIHGLADDNVHFQNSAIFAEAMQNNLIDFTFMVYPNERHHPSGEKWVHTYTMMTNFVRDCLLK